MRKKFKGECCARKVIRVLQVKQKTKDYILSKENKEIRAISGINKTTRHISTLIRAMTYAT